MLITSQKIVLYTYAIVCIFIFSVSAQEVGIRKSIVDSKTGITFNNFRKDSTEVIFYEVKIDNGLVYDAPKKNANPIYSLDVNSIVEYLGLGPKKKFVKIRLVDTPTNTIEGWVRKNNLSKMKYYGRSFSAFSQDSDKEKSNIMNTLIDPRWISKINSNIFSDSTLTKKIYHLNIGSIVYVDSLIGNTAKIRFENNKHSFIPGFIDINSLSSLAVIDSAQTDFDTLFNTINPLVLSYDLNKSGFISYSGIIISKNLKKSMNEGKICREIGNDSLLYEFTLTNDVKDIVKKYVDKTQRFNHDFAMYRILPEKDIFTRQDTIHCKVIEIVHRPKTATISLDNAEETEITNKITKYYISHIDKFDMDIVFQKETNEYYWYYKKNLKSGKYIENEYKPTTVLQRVIKFKKYDVEE